MTDQLAALKHQLSRAVEEADTREQKLLGEKSVLETGLEKEKEKVTAQEVSELRSALVLYTSI